MLLIRNISITVLIIANLASAWLVPLIYMDFELRQDYIAEVLCIERDKPMTVCKGKCFLSDQLDRAMEQQENEEQLSPVEITFFFHQHAFELATNPLKALTNRTYSAYAEQLHANPSLKGIFHPPRS